MFLLRQRRRDRSALRLSLVVAVLALATSSAQAQTVDWVTQVAGSPSDSWVADVEVSGGFVYTAGTVVAFPVIDCVVRKLDLAGNVIWTRQFGTSEFDAASVVHVSGSEVFVGGVTGGAFPGFVDTTPWVNDPFVRRYDTDGNLLGTIQMPRISAAMGGTPYPAYIDATGIYGTDAFDASIFDQNVMVYKYDHAGNVLWSMQFGTTGFDQVDSSWPRSLTVDATGIFVTGSTQGEFPGQTLTGYEDAFVARLDLAGNLLWVTQAGVSDTFSWGSGIASDNSGAYASGMVSSFTGATILQLSRFDLSGTSLWTRELSSVDFDVLFAAIAADASGVCVAGGTEGAFPGYKTAGARDVFARRYDSLGAEVWTVQFGSSGFDEPYAVALAGGDTYLGGIGRSPMSSGSTAIGAFSAHIGPPPVVDSDGDGLADLDEVTRGTNPFSADTDADGIVDGPEVALSGTGTCPNPLDADTDDDGLADGFEVNTLLTSPCLGDTDGDGLSDMEDPEPLVAGALTDVAEAILLDFAAVTLTLPLPLFVGNNANAQAAKRTAVATKLTDAAAMIHAGDLAGAILALDSLKKKVDGAGNGDWMVPSPQQADLAAAITLVVGMID